MSAQPQPSEPTDVLLIRRINPAELGAKLGRAPAPPAAGDAPVPGDAPRRAPPAPATQVPMAQPSRPAPATSAAPVAKAPPKTSEPATVPERPRSAPAVAKAADALVRRPPETAPRTTQARPDTHKGTVVRASPEPAPARKPWLSADKVLFLLVCVLLYAGWHFPTERYISPKRGLGYALGIVGGSLMLLLLVYSLRKRWSWLRFLGSTPSWFRFHMVLGVLGPLCILYHSNFSTGATNSNVALFCMLTVAGSGFIGRYIYVHIHHGLYGRKLELGELRESAESLHGHAGISFLPELAARLDAAEQRILRVGARLSLLGLFKPLTVALLTARLRWGLYAYVRRALRASARKSAVIASQRRRLRATARSFIQRRLAATRRVAAFQSYERLFSLWHTLHVPLIFMMIIAAVVHIIAVHVY